LFEVWWQHHEDRPVTVSGLNDAVKIVADPQGRSRQYLTAFIEKLANSRMAGFVLLRQAAVGAWGTTTYALKRTMHRDHRDHRRHRTVRAAENGRIEPEESPVAPMTPKPLEAPPTIARWSVADWQAYKAERAAILEFDAGLVREQAEAEAYDCCIAEWLRQNPVISPAGRCLLCGEADHPKDAVLLFDATPHGRAWLHSDCWPQWQSRRNAAAIGALEALDIVHDPSAVSGGVQ
jgi:hypothetical protein